MTSTGKLPVAIACHMSAAACCSVYGPFVCLFHAAGKIGNTYPDRPSWEGGSEADCKGVQKNLYQEVTAFTIVIAMVLHGVACRYWIERLSKVATPVLSGMQVLD